MNHIGNTEMIYTWMIICEKVKDYRISASYYFYLVWFLASQSSLYVKNSICGFIVYF